MVNFPLQLKVSQYKDAVLNALPLMRQRRFLQDLYSFPGHSATPEQMSMVTFGHPKFAANLRMGGVAKLIASYAGLNIPAGFKYYQVISEHKNGRAWVMNPNLCKALEELKFVGENNSEKLPTEEGQNIGALLLKEGKVSTVLVNRYERSSSARRACIAIHGCICKGCGINLAEVYGDIAEGFIQVHHLVPLSEIKQKYKVDPDKDLVPLCPNCHSIVHLQEPVLTITELQTLLKKNRKK